ncbi:hypothetical protein SLW70_16100 [Flavobacterium sp. NG2]|uniref:fimbrial biogenesis chaperone n=1 Tax=Flavobacterium sp. NG2 TaxID=3097547 RepID=UPI002A81EC51|nr:hypothetical protein [Flavobacterium sp. NG2]WPR71437.1 hypothetical protein SLW70_16100 [Flavobacterium sp. NG2]
MKRILFGLFFLGLIVQVKAQGDLLVTPTRVIFEGNKQRQELSVVNTGTEPATYSISFVNKNMKEDGSFVDLKDPVQGQKIAEPYLRIFPRQVTLGPQESQVISLQFRRKADMEEGEYRSHLYFRSEKDYTARGQSKTERDSTLLRVQLIPIFGMSIPVIIRTGEVTTQAHFSDLKIVTDEDKNQILKLVLNRSGNYSVYGDIKVEFVPERGKAFEIGAVNGVGVYTNINKRYITIKLDKLNSKTLPKGKIIARYLSNKESKPELYTEAEIILN